MTAPDLSIVMPVHDTGAPLAEAIRSVAAQVTAASWELIVVDDGSTDANTLALLKEAARDPRVRVIRNDGPRGPGAARNAGIAVATAPWLGFLDSDDVWPADSLQRRWARVSGAPGVEWIAGSYASWFTDGTLVVAGKPIQALVPAGRHEVLLRRPVEALARYTPLMGTMLIRKEMVDRVGGFDDRIFYGDDWLLSLKLAAAADLLFLPDVVLHLRRHGLATLMASDRYLIGFCDQAVPAAMRHPSLAPYRSALRARLVSNLFEVAQQSAAKGRHIQALRARLRAIAATPSDTWVWHRALAETLGRADRTGGSLR
jgi:glycosyltransferase involved in cell wall biosynthesis